MPNVVKNKRHEKFNVTTAARDLRKQLCQYVLCDFERQGILHKVGEDFCSLERSELLTDVKLICSYTRMANAIYVTTLDEYYERRNLQNKAIQYCARLGEELNFIAEMYHKEINVDKYLRLAKSNHELSNQIKAWRKSDNRLKDKLKEV